MVADVEIVCVGNELLIGKVVNTNASWIGKRSTSVGITVKRITVVADDLEEMAIAFRDVLTRNPDLVVVTGGLGPTFDDKTLEGIAKALNRKLVVNKEALAMVKAKYADYARTRNMPEGEMTSARTKMALFPEGAMPLVNPVGTAPGVRLEVNSTILFSLPGVPQEMKAIFEATIVPLMQTMAGEVGFFELSIYVDNIMESVLAPLIDTAMHDNPFVYIKSHPKGREDKPHIELHISTAGAPSDNPQERLANAAVQLSDLIEKANGKVVRLDSQGTV